MKAGAWITLIVIIVIVAVGFWLVRSTEPNEEEGLEGEAMEESANGPGGATDGIVPTAEPLPSPTAEGTTTSPVPGAVTISVDETGFTPKTVTVKAGASVTFVNNGQGRHWPASDVHPTHQILPEFDSKPGLDTGEEYSFTFTEAGTWPCHDHLSPQSKCTIVVE